VLWVGQFEQLTGLWTDEGFDSYFAVYINLSCDNYNTPDVHSVESTFCRIHIRITLLTRILTQINQAVNLLLPEFFF